MSQLRKVLTWSTIVIFAAGAVWFGISVYKTRATSGAPATNKTEQTIPEHLTAASGSLGSYGAIESSLWKRADPKLAAERFSELLARAEAGDVVAQRDLANLYQRCSVFSLSPSNMYSMLDTFARMRGEPEGAYDDIKKRFSATCAEVDGGQVIPQVAYANWFERAARQGDTYSKIAIASANPTSLEPGDYQAIARDAVNSADAEAIFALGDLLVMAPESADLAEFKSVATGPYANYAWGIVACRMGADCGTGSFRMDSLCMNTGICGTAGFEDAIRTNAVPAGQQESLDKAIVEVQEVVRKKST